MAKEKIIGEVTHYFDHLGVAVFRLSSALKTGDKVKIKGHTTDFEQEIKEMQIEHDVVKIAKKGDDIGVKVNELVREGDKVYQA